MVIYGAAATPIIEANNPLAYSNAVTSITNPSHILSMGLSDSRYVKKNESINMASTYRITNLLNSASATEPVTRQEMESYVGASNSGITQTNADLRYIKLDGSTTIQGSLNMG